jgi:hypothetical protein
MTAAALRAVAGGSIAQDNTALYLSAGRVFGQYCHPLGGQARRPLPNRLVASANSS